MPSYSHDFRIREYYEGFLVISEQTSTRVRVTPRHGIGLIAFAGILWGTVGVATQAIYQQSAAANPLSIGFFRLAFAAPALLLVCLFVLGHKTWQLAPRDAAVMAVIGAMLALYQACFFTAISFVGVTIATLVTLCIAPIMVAVMSAIFLRERPDRITMLALVCAVCGTILLVGTPSSTTSSGNILLGVAFALGSAFGYAALAMAGRQLAERAHPLQTNLVAFSTGAVLLLVLALLTNGLFVGFPPLSWGLLIYLGLVPSAFGYVLFLLGMRTTPATVASIITLVEPLTAALLAWQLFGEQLSPVGLLGAALLIGALVLLARR
jgi:drug/metabolite transporter, DME family